ncbi:MAG: helix-turn-helix transcriptional regulator [Pseudomonadota bacterium]
MGQVLRETRVATAMTQQELADYACISFQQIQKYEAGVNRVSVSRLFDLSDALGVKVSELITVVEDRLENSGKT